MCLYLYVNVYKEIEYLNKENWEDLINQIFRLHLFSIVSNTRLNKSTLEKELNFAVKKAAFLIKSAETTGYDLKKLLDIISSA